MTEVLEGQVDLCDLGIWSGRMSPELCPPQEEPTKERTSKPSSKKSSKSSAKKLPLFLSLKRDGQTPGASAEWVTAEAPFPSLGEFTMPSFGEQPSTLMEECGFSALPSGVAVSRLSQILEVCPPPKYSLSAKACRGILTRAEKRGKELPAELKAALVAQSAELDGAPAEDEVAIPIEGNGGRPSHLGAGYGKDGDPSFTLNTIEQHGVCASGLVGKGNGETFLMDEKHTSLSGGGGMPGQGYPCAMVNEEVSAAGFSFGQSAKARTIGYEEEISPTLRGGEGGNQKPCVLDSREPVLEENTRSISFQERAGKPGGGKGILIQDEHTGALSTLNIQHVFSIQGNTIDRNAKQNGLGISEDVAHTLDSVDRHGIAFAEEDTDGE